MLCLKKRWNNILANHTGDRDVLGAVMKADGGYIDEFNKLVAVIEERTKMGVDEPLSYDGEAVSRAARALRLAMKKSWHMSVRVVAEKQAKLLADFKPSDLEI